MQIDIYDATALHICRNKDPSFKVTEVPIYNLYQEYPSISQKRGVN